MKHKDVVVGNTYETKIGGELARVIVRCETTDLKGRNKWRVRREDGNTDLPKARSAAALREVTP